MGDLTEHFSRKEFECPCGCGYSDVDMQLVELLEGVRKALGRQIKVTSGCRCETHNANVGGSQNSQHLKGKAADIQIDGLPPYMAYKHFDDKFPNRLGVGRYSAHIHVDVRPFSYRWTG